MTPEKTEDTVSVLNDDGSRKTGEQIREVGHVQYPYSGGSSDAAEATATACSVCRRRRRREGPRHKSAKGRSCPDATISATTKLSRVACLRVLVYFSRRVQRKSRRSVLWGID